MKSVDTNCKQAPQDIHLLWTKIWNLVRNVRLLSCVNAKEIDLYSGKIV